MLKEMDPKKLWDKLKKSSASKLAPTDYARRLYSLKINEGNLHDHLIKLNSLVSQFLSLDEKLEDEKMSLLLLSYLFKSYKSMLQTFYW